MHIYKYVKKSVEKLKIMYKKGKVHSEEYWMFKYYQLLCF